MEVADTVRDQPVESSIDEIRRDPNGYRSRISARYDAEAAEWVQQEMRRRSDLERQYRWRSLRHRLFGKPKAA
jgi:hypothetical protein